MEVQKISNNYNNTLNLPKTDFPMRANLKNKESECLKSWENSNIYDEIFPLLQL